MSFFHYPLLILFFGNVHKTKKPTSPSAPSKKGTKMLDVGLLYNNPLFTRDS